MIRSLGSSRVEGDLAIHDVGNVPASGKKLHDAVPLSRQPRPPGGGFRILFETAH